jgi:hypothetical protein
VAVAAAAEVLGRRLPPSQGHRPRQPPEMPIWKHTLTMIFAREYASGTRRWLVRACIHTPTRAPPPVSQTDGITPGRRVGPADRCSFPRPSRPGLRTSDIGPRSSHRPGPVCRIAGLRKSSPPPPAGPFTDCATRPSPTSPKRGAMPLPDGQVQTLLASDPAAVRHTPYRSCRGIDRCPRPGNSSAVTSSSGVMSQVRSRSLFWFPDIVVLVGSAFGTADGRQIRQDLLDMGVRSCP